VPCRPITVSGFKRYVQLPNGLCRPLPQECPDDHRSGLAAALWPPATLITLSAALRLAVVADHEGGHLELEVAVSLACRGQPEPLASACIVSLPAEAIAPQWRQDGELRRIFDRAHPRTSALITDLSRRVEQYLAVLRAGESTAEIGTAGQVLDILNRELATADRMRREWIAGQGRVIRSGTADLTIDDLVPLDTRPQQLAADLAVPPGTADKLARDYGVLVARVKSAPSGRSGAGPATVAVYRRTPQDLPDLGSPGADQPWQRDESLSHLHLVEEGDATGHVMPADAAVLAALAPDTARCRLDLLMAGDECTQLAATHARAGELQALENATRLVRIPRQRS
jgi:hypothetical protein